VILEPPYRRHNRRNVIACFLWESALNHGKVPLPDATYRLPDCLLASVVSGECQLPITKLLVQVA